MSRIVVIEFSLVEESKEKTSSEILKDIEDFLKNEETTIPWCDKFVNLEISEITQIDEKYLLNKSNEQLLS